MSASQGQLPPSGLAVTAATGDASREEACSVPSMDPRVDAAEPRAALDDTASPEGRRRGECPGVSRQARVRGPVAFPPFHARSLGGGGLERKVDAGGPTYTLWAAGAKQGQRLA